MATDVGTGSTITFSSGFMAEINNISHSGISRESVDTSHMGTTTARTFIPGDLFDPGEITVELNFNTNVKPPILEAAETVTVTFPTSDTWAASGFMTSFEYDDPFEGKMTATATIKFSGDITVA